MARISGSVKWFNAGKGFGFAIPDEPIAGLAGDIFIHYSNIEMNGFKTLNEGQKITFEMGGDPKIKGGKGGSQAVSIQLVGNE